MYTPDKARYGKINYRKCGKSGIKLPELSLGLWQNFGDVDDFQKSRDIILYAFDSGITHFDLANNYGPPFGSAERNFGRVLHNDLRDYRDELIISTKAGYNMWEGPYGNGSSRKYLLSSLDQSLKRMQLDYVDIFYSHRYDPETPIEETMGALDTAVRSGKALYAGISNYPVEKAKEAAAILKSLGTPCLIHQPKYSMLWREPENGLIDFLGEEGIGCIAFSPLAQGMLTNKYAAGIPQGSRAARENTTLRFENFPPDTFEKIREYAAEAEKRGISLAQLAISWVLRDARITSVLVGASSVAQIKENIDALSHPY